MAGEVSAWVFGLLLSGALGAAAYGLGTLDLAGCLAGVGVGTAIAGGLGVRGFAVLALFFVLGSVATRLRGRAKEAAGVGQSRGGARTVRHVLANGLVAALCGVGAALAPGEAGLFGLAMSGALAGAASDTLSSEVGQAYGGPPRLLTTFRRVGVGENGAVTVVGTLAGLVGALIVGLVAWRLGVASRAGIVVLAGLLGNLADSALGATLERRRWLGNAGVNFACTLTGAVSALLLEGALPPS
jgi:uncharacterized protein (TIGR00297 family)